MVILGLVQGLTEFLPVSSTAHLIFAGGLLLLAQERGRRGMLGGPPAGGGAIGVAQALAIAPGISGSGTTIAAGMWMGLRKEEAARFSFMAAIPAVAGAGILGLKDLRLGLAMGYTPAQLLTGFAVAALSGGVAIRWLLSVLRRGRLSYFAAYCLLAGAAVFFFPKGEELWRAGNGPPIVFTPAAPARWSAGWGWRSRFLPERLAWRP